MKRFILTIALLSSALVAGAQTSIEEVLRSVETNNKELQANRQMVTAQKLEAKLDNNLPDPTVTYSHLYGNKEGMGFTGELVASQSFDFPSLYMQRNKLSKQKGENYDRQGEEVRQQILLQAKEACLDLIFLNQQKNLLDIRRKSAEQLAALYQQRLEQGDANILETNKIELELLNVRNEVRMNEAARVNKQRELEMLNGGIAIQLTDTAYEVVELPLSFADLRQEILENDRRLLSLQSAKAVSSRQISVNKTMGLPSFELGYRMNPSSGGERFNGFLVGISIPLYSPNACSRSAIISSICSVPIDRRIVFGLIPWASLSSSVSCAWVVVAGCITSDLTSATFARSENISSLSINSWASFTPPLMSNVKILAPPFGKYLS